MAGLWDHQNKEWQATLDLAKRYGWTIRVARAHGGRVMKCPSPDAEAAHKVRVYTTGRAADSAAKMNRRLVERCEHRDVTDDLGASNDLLDSSRRYLNAARSLISREDAEEQMREIMGLAHDQLVAAESAWDAAVKQQAEAEELLEESGTDEDAPTLLSNAGSSLRKAEQSLKPLPRANELVAATWERIADLKGELAELRQQLDKPRREVARETSDEP